MHSGRRILIVEDDDLVRRSLVAHLAHEGFEVIEAAGGAPGIDALRDEKPDLVLCDLRMPDVDGLAVLEVATQEFPQVPVIVMSGAGLLDDAVGALRLGAWDYLVKPFRAAGVLQHAIARALERARLLRDNERYRAEIEHANRELAASLRRLQEDEVAGRKIQFRLLPERRQTFGPYVLSHALETSAHLSGDFVDGFAIDGRRIGFYLADVAGHGVPSALVTVFLKSFMQQQLKRLADVSDETIVSPRRTLSALNAEMLRENLGKHLTMFYGVIDLDDHRMTWVDAGHFPHPFMVESRVATALPDKGFPVGLFEFAEYNEREMALPRQFTLALCSDGILEVIEGDSVEARTEHLRNLLEAEEVSAEQLIQSLRLEDHRPLPDDVTVLLLQGERP